MKTLLTISTLLLLTACNRYESVGSVHSGNLKFNKICIDGVEYLINTKMNAQRMAPHFKPDGTLYTCD